MKPQRSTNVSSSSSGSRYRGVRLRKWGSWVSEIRLPNSRDRIWLGSYDTPEKAARAFDAAAVCLRGPLAPLNFPSSPPQVPAGATGSLTHQQIQEAAARHANSATRRRQVPPTEEGSPAAAAAPMSEVSSNDGLELDDWSFMDMLEVPNSGLGFPAAIDDECFNFSPRLAMLPLPTDPAEENGNIGVYTDPCLWNFNSWSSSGIGECD